MSNGFPAIQMYLDPVRLSFPFISGPSRPPFLKFFGPPGMEYFYTYPNVSFFFDSAAPPQTPPRGAFIGHPVPIPFSRIQPQPPVLSRCYVNHSFFKSLRPDFHAHEDPSIHDSPFFLSPSFFCLFSTFNDACESSPPPFRFSKFLFNAQWHQVSCRAPPFQFMRMPACTTSRRFAHDPPSLLIPRSPRPTGVCLPLIRRASPSP